MKFVGTNLNIKINLIKNIFFVFYAVFSDIKHNKILKS